MSVGLVIVSHSSKLAAGVVEVAEQMAADVTLRAAGGTDDDGIGTSLEKVMDGISAADTGDGVLVLCDLGSAVMTAESALEFLGEPETVQVANAPLVEGTVAAAVAAQSGGNLAKVKEAAEAAGVVFSAGVAGPSGSTETSRNIDSGAGGAVTAQATLINPMGLHARPAAVLAGELGKMDVEIEIKGVDGQSVMMLMTLGAAKGTVLDVSATGPDAQKAVDYVLQEVNAGFGEV